MISPGLIYLLASALLFTVAAVNHFHSASLSLPISPVITILTAILPLVALVNAYIRPNLLITARSSSSRLQQLLPTALQTIQALLATVLLTLLFEGVVESPALRCTLESIWMTMYKAHNGRSIRRIQDALECCGLNSVRDRAYPFGDRAPSTCAQTYDRSASCRVPWMRAMQTSAGIDVGVVIAVALLQLLGLLMMKEGHSWWTAWRFFSSRRPVAESQSYRPLLPAVEVDEEEENETRDYGTQSSGPRVEPSSVNERNAWAE